jgi:hypothetical protein
MAAKYGIQDEIEIYKKPQVITLNPPCIIKTKELQTPLDKLYQNQACS